MVIGSNFSQKVEDLKKGSTGHEDCWKPDDLNVEDAPVRIGNLMI